MKLKERLVVARQFVLNDIWRMDVGNIAPKRFMVIRQLQILLLAFKKYKEDKVQLHASALTYYTLLSIVPVAAMIFGVAKGFGFESFLHDELSKNFENQKEILNWTMTFADKFLENAKGGLIFGVGFIMLFWSVMKMFGSIESSFNSIWHVKKGRSYVRKFTDYISMMILAPVLIILAGSITVFLSTRVNEISQQIHIIGFFRPVIFILIKLIPYVIIWLALSMLYIIMPNTKVHWRSAAVAGLVAGIMFQLVQWWYIYFQLKISKAGFIYGSFAALPLFLIWLQLSWIIVLIGAEISYANQNVKNYVFKADTLDLSINDKKLLSLLIAHRVVGRFARSEAPETAADLAAHLNIPLSVVKELTAKMVSCHILAESGNFESDTFAFMPASDIHNTTIQSVILNLEERHGDKIEIVPGKVVAQFEQYKLNLADYIKRSDWNVRLMDIV